MQVVLNESRLPNGMKVSCLQEDEVPVLYEQIQTYLKYGIELHGGDVLFDVGANIGLFALWALDHCEGDLNIFAFEPIPPVFEALDANAKRYAPEKIHTFQCGLSNSAKTVKFNYHPNATMLSSAYQDDLHEQRQQLKDSVLKNLNAAPPIIRWIRFLPPFLRSMILDTKMKPLFEVQEVECQLKTVSQMIQDQNLDHIDLLKVDVEKSEWDVIQGVLPEDWQKIKQVVIEIHDIDHRLEQIRQLLRQHGFSSIEVDQDDLFKGSDIYNLYATRGSLH